MASQLLCAGCCFVLLTAALNTVVSELTTLLSSRRSCCGVTFLSRKTQILYVGGKKALKQSQRFKTKRWSMKQLSYYPTDREQSLSMIQCLKKIKKYKKQWCSCQSNPSYFGLTQLRDLTRGFITCQSQLAACWLFVHSSVLNPQSDDASQNTSCLFLLKSYQ